MAWTVSVPVWLAVVTALLAATAILDRALLPGVRWFLRRRVDRVVDRINRRLHVHIQPFTLTRREVLIDRLTYDPRVIEAAEEEMRSRGQPRDVVMARVRRYAHEIVPSFNAYVYFRAGYAAARAFARSIFRVRVGYVDDAGLSRIDPRSSVVFVMNHRSNMDYVLVAYLAAERTALSYAVGEWARVWPLRTLIRAMGAYFIRRGSSSPLYRRVLERYVQMATEAGVVQAIFPEGGLTRDGGLRPPKLGLLDYMLRAFDPEGPRDLVFVPVGLNYDRVLEDRALLSEGLGEAPPGRARAVATGVRFLLRHIALWITGRWHRFGYACVNFGSPISMKAYVADRGIDFRRLEQGDRRARVESFGRELMEAVGRVVPVVPVPLVATVLVEAAGRRLGEIEIHGRTRALIREIEGTGARVYVPRTDEEYAVAVGLRMLILRRMVEAKDGGFIAVDAELPALRYYAGSIRHLRPA